MVETVIQWDNELYKGLVNNAKANGEDVKSYIIRTMTELLEDEHDLQVAIKASAEHEANPVTYSIEEVIKELEYDL